MENFIGTFHVELVANSQEEATSQLNEIYGELLEQYGARVVDVEWDGYAERLD